MTIVIIINRLLLQFFYYLFELEDIKYCETVWAQCYIFKLLLFSNGLSKSKRLFSVNFVHEDCDKKIIVNKPFLFFPKRMQTK